MRALSILIFGLVLGYGGSILQPRIVEYANGHQPYAGQEKRPISSLSSKDVEQLSAGKGWGLAKPAEFNGYPGPAHIIEHAEALDLTETQLAAIHSSFDHMKTRAIALGNELIAAERALDDAFIDKRVNAEKLAKLLSNAGTVRAELRKVHLAAHLEVTPLLSEAQKTRYAELRGYGSHGHAGHGSH